MFSQEPQLFSLECNQLFYFPLEDLLKLHQAAVGFYSILIKNSGFRNREVNSFIDVVKVSNPYEYFFYLKNK
jgi:hypothetical protein